MSIATSLDNSPECEGDLRRISTAAGLITVYPGCTSFVTMALAPILAPSPTVTGPISFDPAPSKTLCPIYGCLNVFDNPEPPLLPSVTPWNIIQLFPTLAVSPITTPIP